MSVMRRAAIDLWDAAKGIPHRTPVTSPRTGGPAGNSQITAWLGAALLVIFVGQMITLTDIVGLMDWHIALGLVLIPPSLLKVATTGWRIVRYYTGHARYREAGPPPLLLRVLGPVLILSTLSLFATGILLIDVGQLRGDEPTHSLIGINWSAKDMHQASYNVWVFAAGLHVFAHLITAAKSIVPARFSTGKLPGTGSRALGILAIACAAVSLAIIAYPAGRTWTAGPIKISVKNQNSSGNTVIVDEVNLQGTARGWIVIQTDSHGAPGRLLGVSGVTSGTTNSLTITLPQPVASGRYWATLHVDDHTLGSYEYPTFPAADTPVKIGSKIMARSFEIVVP